MPPQTLEHQPAMFHLAVQQIRQAQQNYGIVDLIVTIERTGNYHRPAQLAFRQAGFEIRLLHPFATKQYRLPADAGNKTVQNDLYAQHRAAIAGFGLQEPLLDELPQRLQLRVRHRRDLVEKASALACQIREHLHLAWPGYAELFGDLFQRPAALLIVRRCATPQDVVRRGLPGLALLIREQKLICQTPTLEKIVACGRQPVTSQNFQQQLVDVIRATTPRGGQQRPHQRRQRIRRRPRPPSLAQENYIPQTH